MNTTANLTSQNDWISTTNIFLLSITVTPASWIIHFGAIITYIVISSNTVIMSAFLRKEIISPSTILLTGLAFSDTMSAICVFLPKHFGFLFNQLEYISSDNSTPIIVSKYPFCGFIFWMDSVLISAFHLISLMLTTFLTLQKTFVIAFPLRTKRFINKNSSRVCVICTFITLLVVYIVYGSMFKFHKGNNNVCEIRFESWVTDYFFKYTFYLASIIYISATILLTLCSLYIFTKLTRYRPELQKTQSPLARNIHRRSAVIVVSIVVIFILSELLSMLCIYQITFTDSQSMCDNAFYDYSDLTLVGGFAANYFVYLVMSKQLRTVLTRHLVWCLPCVRSKITSQRSTISSISHAMGDRFSSIRQDVRNSDITNVYTSTT